MSDPRNNPDDAYAAFMSMPDSEWRGLLISLVDGGVLTPAEKIGFDRALPERLALKRGIKVSNEPDPLIVERFGPMT